LCDNYFSEQIENHIVDSLSKVTNLTDVNFNGNRFSHSCIAKIKKITAKNQKMIEEQEPNRLKAEIYRLRYEQTKLEQAKERLKQ
jgi:hypothetical protein